MLFLNRIPAAPLDGPIASIWYCEGEPRPFALERVLPSGSAQLIVNLKEDQTRAYHVEDGTCTMTSTSGSVLAGVSSRYGVIDTAEQECVAGVVFRPGGTGAFFAIPAHETRDADIPLELLWDRGRVSELRERLLAAASPEARLDAMERAMLESWRAATLHPAVGFALARFASRPETTSIAVVADRVGLSPKRFIERFKSAVGMTPKHYCRLLRFQRALGRAEQGFSVDWTRIALDCGYFDQSHFIHDFRSFSGITPTGYEAGRTEFRNHVKFLQSDIPIEMR